MQSRVTGPSVTDMREPSGIGTEERPGSSRCDAVTSQPQHPSGLRKQGVSLSLRKYTVRQQVAKVAFSQAGT